jgi:peptidoglycan/xylan/chitin deacetylase (PgdA/CDA1 family)
MMRLQSLLLILVIVAVAIWGVRSAASDDPDPTPAPSEIAAQPTISVSPTMAPTETPRPTREPTRTPEPTSEPTAEPTDEPAPTNEPRPNPPDLGGNGTAVVIDRGESGRLEIALTFDAGEEAGYTEDILDLLDHYGIKASFGVTGDWAERHPELMQRIVDDGHQIINHTYSHRSFTGFSPQTDPLSDEDRAREVETTDEIITDLTGYDAKPYFRFPYNDYDPASLETLASVGYPIVAGYTCDTKAWMGTSAEGIAAECAPDAVDGGPGAVILMHVMQEQDFLALSLIIDEYTAAGYDFVTFEQIVQP